MLESISTRGAGDQAPERKRTKEARPSHGSHAYRLQGSSPAEDGARGPSTSTVQTSVRT